jgi:dTDP-4-amino-4,6-dideoxygalactose transaminase
LIPYSDLQPLHEELRDDLRRVLDEVLDTRQFILGRYVENFERAFAAYSNVEHAIAVNSGTSALHLALLAAGVEPGDEVITVPFTFAATVASIHYAGARPVLVDIDPQSFTMRTDAIESAITPKTRAILPVHLYGQPADMDGINAIARKHGLAVIEDAAQAHGSEYKGRRVGGIGDIACFSFYPTKNLGGCGEGGMVTTNNAELAHKVRLLRDWGQDRKYHHAVRGFNYRMEGLQGAILGVKLPHLERWTEARRAAAAQYDRLLEGAPVTKPTAMTYSRHVYHTYTVRSLRRDDLQRHLQAAGISTAIHYPIPLHMQPAYADAAFPEGSLPEAERASREVLSLPMYPHIAKASIAKVAEAVRTL